VAATMNAMLQDEKNGYLLAMGELTGTTMFVSAVILGFIVRLGGSSAKVETDSNPKENNGESSKTVIGVPCKGPFLRDIAVLCLVTVVSMSYFRQGVIDYVFVHSMLGIYVVYVLLVLGADAYHVFYHLPSLVKDADVVCSDQQHDTANDSESIISVEYNGKCNKHLTGQPVDTNTNAHAVDECTPLTHLSSRNDESLTRKHRHRHHNHTLGDTMIEAISNYSCQDHDSDECNKEDTKAILTPLQSFDSNKSSPATFRPTGWGPKSADGTEALVTFHPHHAIHPHHDKSQVVFRRAGSNNAVVRTLSRGESWESAGEKQEADAPEDVKQQCDTGRNLSRPSSWSQACHINAREWNEHWIDFFSDIYQNPENSKLEVVLLSVELPFTILRKVSEHLSIDIAAMNDMF
jgi:sodium/potassium/calcium exchanger 6